MGDSYAVKIIWKLTKYKVNLLYLKRIITYDSF